MGRKGPLTVQTKCSVFSLIRGAHNIRLLTRKYAHKGISWATLEKEERRQNMRDAKMGMGNEIFGLWKKTSFSIKQLFLSLTLSLFVCLFTILQFWHRLKFFPVCFFLQGAYFYMSRIWGVKALRGWGDKVQGLYALSGPSSFRFSFSPLILYMICV